MTPKHKRPPFETGAFLAPWTNKYTMKENESEPLLVDKEILLLNEDKILTLQTHIYKRRWIVLLVFMYLSIMNNLTQYSFSPISRIVKDYYNVTDLDVNILALIFMVSGFSARFFAMWIIDNKGRNYVPLLTTQNCLRNSNNYLGLGYGIFIAAVLNFIGGWVRYFPGSQDHQITSYYWLLAGQSICAVAQSFIDIAGIIIH